MAQLHLYRNGRRVQSLMLQERAHVVGRGSACDLVLDEEAASRQQFKIAPGAAGSFSLEDLGSSNGTFVNGVREYRTTLAERATIQVGRSLMLFIPGDEADAPEEIQELPEWALTTDEMGTVGAQPQEPATAPVAPAVLRKVQAEALVRTRPHLLHDKQSHKVPIPLDTSVTAIGLGPVRVSLGPSKKNKPKVLAEVLRVEGGDFEVRARGLFGKVEVNGQSTSRHTLVPGDVIVVGGQHLRFFLGLDEDEG